MEETWDAQCPVQCGAHRYAFLCYWYLMLPLAKNTLPSITHMKISTQSQIHTHTQNANRQINTHPPLTDANTLTLTRTQITVFRNVAAFHGMPLLQEMAEWLLQDGQMGL